MKWQKLSSKIILNHPRLTVVEDEVILPNGQASTYIRYSNYADAVVIIAEGADHKILLLNEYFYPLDKAIWQFPAGKVDNGETPLEAAGRELAEEGGVIAGNLTLLGSCNSDSRRTEAKHTIYLASGLTTTSTAHEATEQIEPQWFSVEEIREMISRNEIEQLSALAAWAFYERLVLATRG